jgi:hypothetical protein
VTKRNLRKIREYFEEAIEKEPSYALAWTWIKKGQYKTGKLGGRQATMSELWNAALAA